jgi:glycosyltransferase involved in cell wall biosynthesis
MKVMPPIVSWQPVLTDHQSHTLRALANAASVPLTVMIARREDPTRKAQGWSEANTTGLDVRLLDHDSGLEDIVRTLREHRHSVHLFGSPFDNPRFMIALGIAIWSGLQVYLISEPYSTIAAGYLHDRGRTMAWLKSKLRPWLYRLYGMVLKRNVRGVFAIAPLATAQYRAIGIPASKIHPFGYFVPQVQGALPDGGGEVAASGCRAAFVGNLIATKGLPELTDAARHLREASVDLQIDVYGAGDPAVFGFDNQVIRYAGRIPFGQSQSVIAGYDFLVLPSRYDGWGVVVNEAVLAGVPVVCSDRVGAGAFVRRWGCGLVYASDAPGGLERALLTLATDTALRQQMRQACRDARHLLDPAVAGRYLADVISAPARGVSAPANPWYDN